MHVRVNTHTHTHTHTHMYGISVKSWQLKNFLWDLEKKEITCIYTQTVAEGGGGEEDS